MVNLTNFKILKYTYNVSNDDLGKVLWDKFSVSELKWAKKLTTESVSDTGEDDDKSWDIILIDPKMKGIIDDVLKKYGIEFKINDLTKKLKYNTKFFSDSFMKKMDSFLNNELDVDGILDRMLEDGVDSLNQFERYYLDKNGK